MNIREIGKRRTRWSSLSIGVASLAVAPSSVAARSVPDEVPTFSDVTVHDPSLVRVGSDFYVFGSHLASARTRDGLQWTQVTTDTTAAGGNAPVPDPRVQFQEALPSRLRRSLPGPFTPASSGAASSTRSASIASTERGRLAGGAITPLDGTPKTIALDSFSVVVATSEPLPCPAR